MHKSKVRHSIRIAMIGPEVTHGFAFKKRFCTKAPGNVNCRLDKQPRARASGKLGLENKSLSVDSWNLGLHIGHCKAHCKAMTPNTGKSLFEPVHGLGKRCCLATCDIWPRNSKRGVNTHAMIATPTMARRCPLLYAAVYCDCIDSCDPPLQFQLC